MAVLSESGRYAETARNVALSGPRRLVVRLTALSRAACGSQIVYVSSLHEPRHLQLIARAAYGPLLPPGLKFLNFFALEISQSGLIGPKC